MQQKWRKGGGRRGRREGAGEQRAEKGVWTWAGDMGVMGEWMWAVDGSGHKEGTWGEDVGRDVGDIGISGHFIGEVPGHRLSRKQGGTGEDGAPWG